MACIKRGFTLIELITVMIIIGVLAAIAASMMLDIRARAIATEAVTGVSVIATAIQQYYAENGSFPYTGSLGDLIDYLPGLSIRTSGSYGDPATDGTPPSLDNLYFSQECYSIAISGLDEGPAIVCTPYTSSAPRAEDARKTVDNNYPFADLVLHYKSKKITQFSWSKSGYPGLQ